MHAFRRGEAVSSERTDRDVPLLSMLIGVMVSAVGVAILLASLHVSPAAIAIGVALTLLAYCASAQAAQAIYPEGTVSIPLSVQSCNCGSSAPMPNSPLALWIYTGGTSQSLPVTTVTAVCWLRVIVIV